MLGLSSYTTEQRLAEAFSQYGQVVEGDWTIYMQWLWVPSSSPVAIFSQFTALTSFFPAKIAMDRVSDRSKGFGFVTLESKDDAEKAITEMDGKVGPRFHFSISFF